MARRVKVAKMFLSQSEKSEVISKLTQENYQLRKQIRLWKEAFYLLKSDHEILENFQTGEWREKLKKLEDNNA